MGSKPKQATVKPAVATAADSGVRNSSVNLPGFGSSATTMTGPEGNRSIDTTYTTDPQFQTILGSAKQGVQDNQSIFNLTPDQQFAQVDSNPYYQYAKEQNRRYLATGQADARQAASRSGIENSTMAGAMEASLLNDASQQDLASRLGAIDYNRGLAGENLATQQGIIDQLYGYTRDPNQLSNDTLRGSIDNQNQVGMFNAGQIQQASQLNAQMRQQAQLAAAQRRSALIGNLIGGASSIGAAFATSGGSAFAKAALAASAAKNPVQP